MTRYRTQSRFKPLLDFMAQPVVPALVATIAALAFFAWLG